MQKKRGLGDKKIKNIQLQILEASYWEHFKMAKDLSLYLPINHPKRLTLEAELNIVQEKINKLK